MLSRIRLFDRSALKVICPKPRYRTALAVSLAIIGCDGQSTDPFASLHLTMAGGDKQIAALGSFLSNPLSIRVMDQRGKGIPDMQIDWRIETGAGVLATFPAQEPLTDGFSRTDINGVASVIVKPTLPGVNVVVASAAGRGDAYVVFTTTVVENPAPVIIVFGPFMDCTGPTDPYRFNPNEVALTPGTPVEWQFASWVHPACTARIMSTLVPPGGESFDSGVIKPGQPFRFVPKTAGTWEYVEEWSGGKGSFIVH